jgi:RNA polymerase sigma factor (sigma-70 family)
MMESVNVTDGQLLARILDNQAGREAFDQIVRRYWPMVYRICLRHCRTPEDAEDAAQNVFVTLTDRARDLRSRTCLAGWLHRTACYTAMRWRRDLLTRRRHERLAGELRPESDLGGAGLEAREPLDQLHRALGALPEDYRNALILHHFEGYTVEQVAELLNAPTGTVAARLSRGRAMLRERLALLGVVLLGPDLDQPAYADEMPAASSQPAAFYPAPAIKPVAALPASAALAADAAGTAGGGGLLSTILKLKVTLIMIAVPVFSLAAGGVATYEILSPSSAQVAIAGSSSPHAPLDARTSSGARGNSQTRVFIPELVTDSSVPEPSCLLPLAMGCALLNRRRRKPKEMKDTNTRADKNVRPTTSE